MRAIRAILAAGIATTALVLSACESTPKESPAAAPAPAGVTSAAAPEPAAAAPAREPAGARATEYDRPGYSAFLADGRIWVFAADSPELAAFVAGHEPGKYVTVIGEGPGGHTVRAVDRPTLDGYLVAREGFATFVSEGRIWVFRPGSPALADYRQHGEPGKFVTRIGSGPRGMTVRGPDMETIVEYLTARPGFVTRYSDGRLWVFPDGSKALGEYEKNGEPGKFVTRLKEGPLGLTIRAPDMESLKAYMACAPGFATYIRDGRVWVFRPATKPLDEFLARGEPTKHVTRPGAGPLGMTIKGPDSDTLDAYLRAVAVR
jgi:hypothetical protein